MFNIIAHAQDNKVDIQSEVGGGFFAFECVAEMVTSLVNIALIIAGILLLIYFVWSGLQWIISGGDKGKVQDARTRITHAVIGLAIVACSYAIWLVAINFFGIKGNLCADNPTGEGSSGSQVLYENTQNNPSN